VFVLYIINDANFAAGRQYKGFLSVQIRRDCGRRAPEDDLQLPQLLLIVPGVGLVGGIPQLLVDIQQAMGITVGALVLLGGN